MMQATDPVIMYLIPVRFSRDTKMLMKSSSCTEKDLPDRAAYPLLGHSGCNEQGHASLMRLADQ